MESLVLANDDDLAHRPYNYVLTEPTVLLVVDDDPIQREFCSVYLTAPNVQVETADCAEAGLERLTLQSYSAALIDVEMPGMSGIDMVRHLRAQPAFDHLPIMVVTGKEDMASIDRAFEAGATSFMCKPVNWRLLAHQVRFMIRAHRAIRGAEDRA